MLHKNATIGDVHKIVNWEVADAAALAALTLVDADLYKLAYQIDIQATLLLTNVTGPVWTAQNSVIPFDAFHAWNSIGQVIPGTAATIVQFDTEDFDIGGNYATNRFTAAIAGYYQFTARILVPAAVGVNSVLNIIKNGGPGIDGMQIDASFFSLVATGMLFMDIGDYAEISLYLGTGRTLSHDFASQTFFQGYLIRAT